MPEHWQAWAGVKESPTNKRGWRDVYEGRDFSVTAVEYAGMQAPPNREKYPLDADMDRLVQVYISYLPGRAGFFLSVTLRKRTLKAPVGSAPGAEYP